ncbi:MAG: formate dehydrogenase accessory protein FdhE [Chloroflexota bacterium]
MTQDSDNILIGRLNEEGRRRGLPSRFLEFYSRLLRIQLRTEQSIKLPKSELGKEEAKERNEGGLPLLKFDELALDKDLLQSTFAEVTALFADFPDLFGKIPGDIGEIPIEAIRDWFEGAKLPATQTTGKVDEEILETIIHAALKPFLVSYARVLIKLVNQESWRRQYCPICGGKPDFSFLDKERGSRWLICSRCDSEWLFQRLQCPYCGTQDQNVLSFFPDAEGLYRLYVCDKCHTYIKTIDSRKTESTLTPSLERVLTLDLDRQGREKGYKPGYSENVES